MRRELVFTAYNRPEYLAETIGSWNQVSNILDWDVSYLLEPSSAQEKMIEKFNGLECKSMLGVVNDHRLGVLRNPYAAMSSVFDAGNDFAVLAEDDIIVSSDILEYFEWASVYYENNPEILGVLAFSRLPEGYSEDANVVWKTEVFCPLVWGTWKDRWENLIKPNWDLDYSSGNPDGSEAGWDWNMLRLAVNNKMKFVFPEYSRSNHIGRFGGVHTSEFSFPDSQAATFTLDHKRKKIFRATNHHYYGI